MRAYSSAVEQPAHNRSVLGSIPSGPTIRGKIDAKQIPALHFLFTRSPLALCGEEVDFYEFRRTVGRGSIACSARGAGG